MVPPPDDDPGSDSDLEGEQDRAERARWLIGVETLLDPTDPLDSFHRQLRFCAALGAEVPAVYDACSYRTWPGSELQRLTSTKVPPRTDRLFAIHAVTADEGKREQGCWLHTHGLSRAGCPEIDLLGMPVELCDAASTLINGVGDLLIGAPLPDPETPFEVGSGRTVACRPWPDAIRDMAPDALGGLQDREGDDNSHAGYRVVLVDAPDDRAPGAPRWQPPLDVVRHIDQQDGILFVSRRETERMAMLARERWAEFAMLFARHREDGWQFLVKHRHDRLRVRQHRRGSASGGRAGTE